MDGFDHGKGFGWLTGFFSKGHDTAVDAAGGNKGVITPDSVKDLVSNQDSVGVGQEQVEEIVFFWS